MKKKRPVSPSFAGCVTVFCDPETFLKDEGVVQRILQEEGVHGSIGCHAKKAHLYSTRVESYIIGMVEKEKNVVALGEMGLDFSGKNIRNHQKRQQRSIYRKQLVLAARFNKTVVIHSREAGNDCFTIAKEELPTSAKIHVHCFMQGWQDFLLWFRRFPNAVVGVI